MARPGRSILPLGALLCLCAYGACAQDLTPAKVSGALSERRALATPEDAAIGYFAGPLSDAASALNGRLAAGTRAPLAFDADSDSGYLKSLLDALGLSTKSQLLVYSKTSIQAPRISPSNPRAMYFSDDVVVAYIRGAPFIEIAALDPAKGVQLYTLTQSESPSARLSKGTDCLRCHVSLASMDVPGMLLRSVPTGPDGRIYPQLGNYVTDHRSPIDQRWGGWYVTGNFGRAEHMGNLLLKNWQDPDAKVTSRERVSSLESRFEQRGYLTPFSDVAALMVFEHQMHMTNLLVRVGWDARFALSRSGDKASAQLVQALLSNGAKDLVDYMLFVEEAALPDAVVGSAFAAEFASRGPFDRKGRSLRQLDLSRRLLRYPCSYMIYSDAFEALPPEMKAAVYDRLWAVLSGKVTDAVYRTLSAADRRAIVEILQETKPALPAYFQAASLP